MMRPIPPPILRRPSSSSTQSDPYLQPNELNGIPDRSGDSYYETVEDLQSQGALQDYPSNVHSAEEEEYDGVVYSRSLRELQTDNFENDGYNEDDYIDMNGNEDNDVDDYVISEEEIKKYRITERDLLENESCLENLEGKGENNGNKEQYNSGKEIANVSDQDTEEEHNDDSHYTTLDLSLEQMNDEPYQTLG